MIRVCTKSKAASLETACRFAHVSGITLKVRAGHAGLRENDDWMGKIDSARFIAVILDEEMDIGSRDNALYRVLTESLRARLLRRFRAYEKRAPFAFEDALQEFFLYLRGDANNAYSIFRELKDWIDDLEGLD